MRVGIGTLLVFGSKEWNNARILNGCGYVRSLLISTRPNNNGGSGGLARADTMGNLEGRDSQHEGKGESNVNHKQKHSCKAQIHVCFYKREYVLIKLQVAKPCYRSLNGGPLIRCRSRSCKLKMLVQRQQTPNCLMGMRLRIRDRISAVICR